MNIQPPIENERERRSEPSTRAEPIREFWGGAHEHQTPSLDPDEPAVAIRRARLGDANLLTALAMRSKAHWGYDRRLLEAVRPMLTLSENSLSDSPVFLLAVDDEPAGFYRLTGIPPEGELADLWLEPGFIGRGLGRQLFEHARDTAAELGFDE